MNGCQGLFAWAWFGRFRRESSRAMIVPTVLQTLGGSILALTDMRVSLFSSTEELKVFYDKTKSDRDWYLAAFATDLGEEDELKKL